MPSVKRLVVGSLAIATPVALRWWLTHRPGPEPVRGVVVTAEGGLPVTGIRVEAREVVTFAVLASDTTGASGEFTLTGVTDDEFGLWVDGTSAGRARGYVAASRQVVPSWGAAVSWGSASFPMTVRLTAAAA